MRTLVFCGDPGVPIHGPSGASAHLRQIASALQALGDTVCIAAITPHDARGRYAIDFDLPSVTVGKTRAPEGLRGAGQRWDAARLASRAHRVFGRFDRIWERASLHSAAGLRLARRTGARHLLEVNAPLDLHRAGALRGVVRHTDRVLAVSPWMAHWARDRGGRRVTLLPNASALPVVPRALPSTLTLVHHGSLRPWHGTDFFPTLLEALPEARLKVIGNGDVPEHDRLDRLPWLPLPRLAREIAGCHVGILPFPPEAPPWFDPLKAADYRRLGVPSVGSLHPAARADRNVGLGDLNGWARAVRESASVSSAPGPSWEEVLTSTIGCVYSR